MSRKRTGFNKTEYNREYNKGHFDRIPFDAPKESGLKAMIELGAKKHGMSKNAYITNAVNIQLEKDGITPDMLTADTQTDTQANIDHE